MSARHPIAAPARRAGAAWAGLLALGLAGACTSGGGGGTGGVIGPEPAYEPPGTANDPGGPNGTKPSPEPTGPGGYEPGGGSGYDPPPSSIGGSSGSGCSYCGKAYTCSITVQGQTASVPVVLGAASNGACAVVGEGSSFSCDGTVTSEDGGTISWSPDGQGGFTIGGDDCTLGGSSSSGSSGSSSSSPPTEFDDAG